jgi:hypothetical protein
MDETSRGRVYDPELCRFMSADPFVQAPYNSQSYNRYSYVFNNPLSFTEPSGFTTDCNNQNAGVGHARVGIALRSLKLLVMLRMVALQVPAV